MCLSHNDGPAGCEGRAGRALSWCFSQIVPAMEESVDCREECRFVVLVVNKCQNFPNYNKHQTSNISSF